MSKGRNEIAQRWIAGAALAILVTMTVPAMAHDPALHKTRPVEGTIDTVAPDHITLGTSSGPVRVVLSDETTVERGDTPIGVDQIRPGDHVAVYGPKLPSGEVAAREVIVHDGGSVRSPHAP
jgi:hypothetical protein